MSGGLSHRPITVKEAMRWVKAHHRRLPTLRGGMWAIGCARDAVLVGVAVVGLPRARMTMAGAPTAARLEVHRVAVLEGDASATGQRGACSMLYGACARAARGMGALDLFTSIHHDEPGTSLRAAGWIEDPFAESKGGEWDRDARPRQLALEPGAERVWYAPWSAEVRRIEAAISEARRAA